MKTQSVEAETVQQNRRTGETAGSKVKSGSIAMRIDDRGLGMTWIEACEDKSLQNLPYKIELNRHGQVIMSPTRFKHSFYQGTITHLLATLLPDGQVSVECAVDCAPEGTFVADVAWVSHERFKIIVDEASCSIAPEICVEVWSPSNSPEEIEMKRRLYLAKGAQEFWYCDAKGDITCFDANGPITRSRLCPSFPANIA
jgi:Uma2 family endonuclease